MFAGDPGPGEDGFEEDFSVATLSAEMSSDDSPTELVPMELTFAGLARAATAASSRLAAAALSAKISFLQETIGSLNKMHMLAALGGRCEAHNIYSLCCGLSSFNIVLEICHMF